MDEPTLEYLSDYADEFLVHGVDVEGKRCNYVPCYVVKSFTLIEISGADRLLKKSLWDINCFVCCHILLAYGIEISIAMMESSYADLNF